MEQPKSPRKTLFRSWLCALALASGNPSNAQSNSTAPLWLGTARFELATGNDQKALLAIREALNVDLTSREAELARELANRACAPQSARIIPKPSDGPSLLILDEIYRTGGAARTVLLQQLFDTTAQQHSGIQAEAHVYAATLLANQWIAAKRLLEAQALLAKVSQDTAYSLAAGLRLAQTYHALHDTQAATRLWIGLADRYADDPAALPARLNAATTLENSGDAVGALAQYEKLTADATRFKQLFLTLQKDSSWPATVINETDMRGNAHVLQVLQNFLASAPGDGLREQLRQLHSLASCAQQQSDHLDLLQQHTPAVLARWKSSASALRQQLVAQKKQLQDARKMLVDAESSQHTVTTDEIQAPDNDAATTLSQRVSQMRNTAQAQSASQAERRPDDTGPWDLTNYKPSQRQQELAATKQAQDRFTKLTASYRHSELLLQKLDALISTAPPQQQSTRTRLQKTRASLRQLIATTENQLLRSALEYLAPTRAQVDTLNLAAVRGRIRVFEQLLRTSDSSLPEKTKNPQR